MPLQMSASTPLGAHVDWVSGAASERGAILPGRKITVVAMGMMAASASAARSIAVLLQSARTIPRGNLSTVNCTVARSRISNGKARGPTDQVLYNLYLSQATDPLELKS